VARPLLQLTRNNVPFEWTDSCEKEFQELKRITCHCNVTLLSYHLSGSPTRMETDASDGVVAGVSLNKERYTMAYM